MNFYPKGDQPRSHLFESNAIITYATENEPFNPETKPTIMDKAQILARVKTTFEASHNQCSLDYLSSRLGTTSEEAERILIDYEREGRARYDAAKGIWKWLK